MNVTASTDRTSSRIQRAWAASRMSLALALCAAQPAWADTVVVGNGQASRDTRSVAEFTSIGLSGGLSLKLRQGSPASVVVYGDANLLSLLETVIEGSKALQLRWKRGTSVRTQVPTGVEVVVPHIDAVASAGSGDIEIDTMKVPRLALSIKGSGDIHAKRLNTEMLTIGVAGSGDLKLAGQSSSLTIDLAGSGSIDASELRCNDVTVGIAGSGDAMVHAARKLVASIAGSGDVLYSGDPSVQLAIAGSGSVRKR